MCFTFQSSNDSLFERWFLRYSQKWISQEISIWSWANFRNESFKYSSRYLLVQIAGWNKIHHRMCSLLFFFVIFFPPFLRSLSLSPSIHPLIQYKFPDATELISSVTWNTIVCVCTRFAYRAAYEGECIYHRLESTWMHIGSKDCHIDFGACCVTEDFFFLLCGEKYRRKEKKRQLFFFLSWKQGF